MNTGPLQLKLCYISLSASQTPPNLLFCSTISPNTQFSQLPLLLAHIPHPVKPSTPMHVCLPLSPDFPTILGEVHPGPHFREGQAEAPRWGSLATSSCLCLILWWVGFLLPQRGLGWLSELAVPSKPIAKRCPVRKP